MFKWFDKKSDVDANAFALRIISCNPVSAFFR